MVDRTLRFPDGNDRPVVIRNIHLFDGNQRDRLQFLPGAFYFIIIFGV
jgi:hypothetical protein